MYRIKNPTLIFHRLAIMAVAVAALVAASPVISHAHSARLARIAFGSFAEAQTSILAQDEGASDDETAVPAEQVNKYIAVYLAMQKNHNLTVDQAAPQQGLTVDQFRDIEDKIGRNPVIHERVLDALSKSKTADAGKNSSKSKSGDSK